MSAVRLPLPELSDAQLSYLFESTGIEVPAGVRERLWAEARELKACGARLAEAAGQDLAKKAGCG